MLFCTINHPNNKIEIKKLENGSGSTLNSTSGAISGSKWYKLKIDWSTNGDITFTLVDTSDDSTVASVQTTDSTYTSGSHISFKLNDNNESSEAWWDYVQKA